MIVAFIMMCQLMFEALNMNEILLSTRSRENSLFSSKLTSVLIHSRHLNFPERACPMSLVIKASAL